MATYIGDYIDTTRASQTISYLVSPNTPSGTEFYTWAMMENQDGYYKCGSLEITIRWLSYSQVAFSVHYIIADEIEEPPSTRVVGDLDNDNNSVTRYINYKVRNNYISFRLNNATQSNILAISIKWTGSSDKLATYTVNSYTYDGNQHTGLTNISSNCFVLNPSANTNTNAGTYTVSLAANQDSIYALCGYFATGVTAGTASNTAHVNWTISKADQTWNAANIDLSNYATDNAQISITGQYVGTLIYSGYSAIISLDTHYTPALVYREIYGGGTTPLVITASGDNNHNARSVMIYVNCGSGGHYVRIYVNGTWQRATPYIWDGTAWQEAVAYVYNGTEWRPTIG